MIKLSQATPQADGIPQTSAILDVITQPTQPERTTTQPKERARTRHKDMYDKVGYTIALIASLAIAGLFWYIGAYYTLRGLSAFKVNTSSGAWWILPLAITAVELWLMPKRGTRWQAVGMFMLILAFDIATSWHGLLADLGGKSLPLATGITLPNGGAEFHLLCVVISLACAFLPEKLGKWAYREITGTWL